MRRARAHTTHDIYWWPRTPLFQFGTEGLYKCAAIKPPGAASEDPALRGQPTKWQLWLGAPPGTLWSCRGSPLRVPPAGSAPCRGRPFPKAGCRARVSGKPFRQTGAAPLFLPLSGRPSVPWQRLSGGSRRFRMHPRTLR